MAERLLISAEIVLLSPEEGGRRTPLLALASGGEYRPHIVIQDRDNRVAKIEVREGMNTCVEEYLGVAFWDGPDPLPVGFPFQADSHADLCR